MSSDPKIENAPQSIAAERKWIGWKLVSDTKKPGKIDKLPWSALHNHGIGATRTSADGQKDYTVHWQTVAEALDGALKHNLAGIGYVFELDRGIIFIDFDKCFAADGTLDPAVAEILKLVPSYTERSVSGTGLHVLCLGQIPKNFPKDEKHKIGNAYVELYHSDRYMAFTGDVLGAPSEILFQQKGIDAILAAIGATTPKPKAKPQDRTKKVSAGDRHNYLKSQCAHLFNTGLSGAALFAALSELNQSYCDPPKPEAEVQSLVDHADRNFRAAALDEIEGEQKNPAGKYIGASRRSFLRKSAVQFYAECDDPHYGYDLMSESILWMHLLRLNLRQCAPPLPQPEIRAFSVELYEELSGDQVARYPGMFEDNEQPDTDLGFGKHFAREVGDYVRFDAQQEIWFVYRKGIWRPDLSHVEVRRLLKEYFFMMYQGALDGAKELWPLIADVLHFFTDKGELIDPRDAKNISGEQMKTVAAYFSELKEAKRWEKGQSNRKLTEGIRLAQTEFPDTRLEPWDSDPLLFNALNTTIDMRTGEELADRRRAYLTKQFGVIYDTDAKCPEFEKVISRSLPDANVLGFVQDFFGMGLSGLVPPEILIFLGEGSNGKSLLLKICSLLWGTYYKKVSMSSFMAAKHPSPGGARTDLASLRGKRLASASEADRRASLDLELLKDWTGGEKFEARELYEKSKFAESTPEASLVLSMNKAPKIIDTSLAAWRRLRYIPFDVVIPPEERNDKLAAQLVEAEGPGILQWFFAGWWRVWERISADQPPLVAPEAVIRATEKAKVKENHVARFLDEKLVVNLKCSVTTAGLYREYKVWCEDNGEFYMNAQQLILELGRVAHDRGLAVDLGGHHNHAGLHKGFGLLAPAVDGSPGG